MNDNLTAQAPLETLLFACTILGIASILLVFFIVPMLTGKSTYEWLQSITGRKHK